ncbi:MAG: response regulator [Bacteroidetes bacterium]|nr:response regulator [Bacteroidota bacterium]
MRLYSFKSIRTRLTFWFLILTLIPLLVVLIITYFQRVDAIKNQTIDKLVAIRDLKAEQINVWLTERVSDMNTLSIDNDITSVKNLFDNKKNDISDTELLLKIQNHLGNYVKNYPAYNELFILNPQNGKIVISTRKYADGEDKSANEYFTEPMKTHSLSIKDIYYSNTLSEISMTYSIPIFDTENMDIIVGILVARVDLNNSLFRLLFDRVGLGKTGETLIVNEDVLALNILRWYNNAPLNLKIKALPALNASKGQTGVIITQDYRGEEVLAAYTYIPQTKWGFVCKQDMSELNAPIDIMILHFIIIFIVASLIITLTAISISKSISKSIVAMNVVAKKIRSGNFSIRNKITSQDELGLLALEFNNMADMTESRINVQQGISQITEIMIGRTSMNDFGLSLLKELKKISGANICAFYILNESDQLFEHLVSIGANKELLESFDASYTEGDFGNAISSKSIYYLQNIPANTIFKYKTIAGTTIPKELITIPILVENTVVATISLAKISSFSIDCHDIINKSWDSINTSYSNLIASERTRVFADHLSRINKQLEVKSNELEKQTSKMKLQAEELYNASRELQIQNIELESQKMQVMTANKLKSEFLSNMSHELRTPLNSIMALSSVLITDTKSKLNKDESNYLSIIERNGKRLLRLINDILDLSKIEAGKMEIIPAFISIENLIQLVTENVQSISDNKGISINLEIPQNLPRIQTDESRLHQVLINIVSNAIKFTDKGSVDIIVKNQQNNIVIEIKDTGIGISENILPHVFDEFRQADGTSSRKYEGTGLGLAIAKKMTEILGGSISAESELGVGSTFSVTIPVTWHGSQSIDKPMVSSNVLIKHTDNTILVVDDDPKVITDISNYLSQCGYNTISATNGMEAIKLATKYKPIAITLDIIMPEMDGWEVLQQLKSNTETNNIPVIVVSVSEDRDTGFALGAISYLNKPIDKNLLISEIRKINKSPGIVMIVDDDEFDLKRMADMMKAQNISTILAVSGQECLDIIENTIPDILVLDLLMPDIDGFKVLHQIKNKLETKDLPVIVVTAKDINQDDRKRLQGNVTSIIAKSDSTSEDLFTEIKRIIDNIDRFKKPNQHKFKSGIKEAQVLNQSKQKDILILEDNPDNMTTIKAILKGNYNLLEATNGEEGLKFIEIQKPDLILLDMSLPNISGQEIVSILKADDKTKSIPIIAVTAQAMIGDREMIMGYGCDGYVSKPINAVLLLSEINSWLSN